MTPRKFPRFALWLAAIGLVLAACGGGGGDSGAPAANLTLTAEDIKWDRTSLTARAGQTVNLTIKNAGTLEHNFAFDEAQVNVTIPAGDTETVTFTASAPGTYTFYCNIPGHSEAGMTGTFTVTP